MSELDSAVREFVDGELLTAAREYAEDGKFPQRMVDSMAELGLLGTIIPREYGGLGLNLRSHVELSEEIARGWLSMAGVLNPHVLCCRLLLDHGTEQQRRDLLPRMASGEFRACFSLTEAHAGSDVQAITSTATPTDDGRWAISARKRWITNGLGASLVFVLVKTDPNAVPSHKGMTCFIVEKKPWQPVGTFENGVGISEIIEKMGDRGVETTDLVLDGYTSSSDRILGGEAGLGKGFKQMIGAMESGRVGAASLCVGVAQRCLDVALDYARDRHTFGVPIGEHQGVQSQLADMATSIRAARLLTYSAADAKDRGERIDLEAGMAKLFASEAAQDVAEAAFRIHGANGYSKGLEIERLLRDVLSLVSAEGPSEIQRMVIARSLIKTHGSAAKELP